MKIVLAIGATLLALLPAGLAAETVVVLGNDLRYGVCHSEALAKSRSCALENCFKHSTLPVTCKVVYRSTAKGHYALAIGSVSWGVGTSPKSPDEAAATALAYCQQAGPCVVAATWEETPEDD